MARRLISIGIDSYESQEIENLKYATKDAEDIYKILIDKNHGQFDPSLSKLLLNPSKKEMESTIEQSILVAQSDDTFLIFFAGHGKLSQDSHLFLCPIDANSSFLISTCVSIDNLNSLFNWSQAIRNIIILDCCYSGAIGKSFRFRGHDSPNKSLEELSGRGKVIITGSGAWEKTREIDEINHGLFTYHIINGIKTGIADIDSDGLISCNDIFRYTYDKVTEDSTQEPTLWGIDIKGDMYLAVNPLSRFRKIISKVDEREMAIIDDGSFIFSISNEEKILPSFYMDIYPVTNKEYFKFVQNTGYSCPKHWDSEIPPTEILDHPVVHVTYKDAENYAKWAGKRLPTEEEWEKAARGEKGQLYPWGNSPTIAKTNIKESQIGNTTEVTKYKSGISPYGIYDLAGNVWEWCSTKTGINRRVLKGSAFSSPFEYAIAYSTNDADESMEDNDTGFRCVLSAEY